MFTCFFEFLLFQNSHSLQSLWLFKHLDLRYWHNPFLRLRFWVRVGDRSSEQVLLCHRLPLGIKNSCRFLEVHSESISSGFCLEIEGHLEICDLREVDQILTVAQHCRNSCFLLQDDGEEPTPAQRSP